MKKKILFLGLLSIFLPLNVLAANESIKVTCDKTVVASNEVGHCSIVGKTDKDVSSIYAKLTSTEQIKISNVQSTKKFKGTYDNNFINYNTIGNVSNEFTIATFDINVTGAGSIKLSEVDYKLKSGETVSVLDNSLVISLSAKQVEEVKEEEKEDEEEEKSNDATLKSITISSGSINFKKDVTYYDVVVGSDVTDFEITAECNDEKASVIIPENILLNIGNNTIAILVKAEDGTEKTYTLVIEKRLEKLSDDSKLSNLIINGHDINFDTNIYSYDIGNIEVDNLELEIVPNSPKAKVNIFGDKSIGENDAVVIDVIAENGTSTLYTIYVSNVGKEEVKNPNEGYEVYILIIIILALVVFIETIFINKNKTTDKKKVSKKTSKKNNNTKIEEKKDKKPTDIFFN